MSIFYQKGDVQIRKSEISDIGRMQDDLRESDRREIEASHGHTPMEALRYSYSNSCFRATVLYKGEPVAMFGVVKDPNTEKVGSVWMLATNGVYAMKAQFLRLSRRYIKLMQTQFLILYNFVDARNAASVRWLKWCGAVIDDARPYGVAEMPFHFFAFAKEKPLV